jgi:cytochrome b561
MQFTNTPQRYGAIASGLHWALAGLLIFLAGLGLYMVSLPDAGFSQKKILLILLHKQYGMLALWLALARLAWRVGNVLPALMENMPDWQKVAARFVHLCFYGLMLALPVSGWLMSAAADIPVYFFGWYLPNLIAPNERHFHLLITVHQWLSFALMACFAAHVGAAVRHHFVLGDDTLRKMVSAGRVGKAQRCPRGSEYRRAE